MALTVSAMFISVHDPDAALGSYRDALGLEVRADVASEGFRWVTRLAPRGRTSTSFCPSRTAVVRRPRSTPSCTRAGVAAGCDLPPTTSTRFGRRAPRCSRSRRLNPGECATARPGSLAQPRPHPGAALGRPAIAVMTCTDRTVRR
jgi:hypothetical protein